MHSPTMNVSLIVREGGTKNVIRLTPQCAPDTHKKVYSPYTCTLCWHCSECGATGCDNTANGIPASLPIITVYERWNKESQRWERVPESEVVSCASL